MNLKKIVLIVGIAITMAGCGSRESNVEVSTESVTQTEVQGTVSEEITEESTEESPVEKTTVKQEEGKVETKKAETASSDDNFSVDQDMVIEFANNVKAVVMEKDLEALAGLTSYPIYINFSDGGKSIENKEAMIALGSDKVFTEELIDSVNQADENSLSPSRAGFILTKESGAPNVVFGLRDGKLGVSAINY